ncbi:Aste57867_19756 [Aphanomyces stellatus]|uniref:Aste57867_19756 protein n=1 Tax=Aphanomyces stellatus TaxID=120398 RepID=A0A485LD59_9STRA|nr:hypothetical protein As57867_019691 [Aphanomyces stellatus]VFT96454.1 Aste57867_19756 [Aphanomyces stellatus]
MTKVHAVRVAGAPPKHIVRLNKVSLVYAVFFVANLVTEPLKAYVSEPLPWALNAILLNHDNVSFDTFVNSTYRMFATKYNNRTLIPTTVFAHEKAANIALLRYNMSLPSNELSRCSATLIQCPGTCGFDLSIDGREGVMLFGNGIVDFFCDFLAQNASTQELSTPRYMCQHLFLVGYFVASNGCVWIEPLPTPRYFSVYHAIQVVETSASSWLKFGYRVLVSCAILCESWRMYYAHYGPLLSNLKTIGMQPVDRGPLEYNVHVGDPTWIILSHPYICTAMTVDVLFSTTYYTIALFRVSQLQDLWQFVVGSFCGSSLVWASYTAMRLSTQVIKRFRWESYCEPLDPSIMALSAAFYAGPMVNLICQSRLMLMFHVITQWVPKMKSEAMELSSGMIGFLLMFASVAFIYSVLARAVLRHYQHSKFGPTKYALRFDTVRYNDWKHLLLNLFIESVLPTTTKSGGTLYHLFDDTTAYRKFPLFSSRGSDCFVREFNIKNGQITGQFRLSLLHGLDCHAVNSRLRIATCNDPHLNHAVCVCNETFCHHYSRLQLYKFVLHPGTSNCRWLL